MMHVTLIIAAAVLISLVRACSDGWLQHDESCYHFSHDIEPWPSAREICLAMGGYLAQINSLEESHFLTSQTRHLRGGYWIGLNDLQEEGTYRWTNDNTRLDPSLSSLWNVGEPSANLSEYKNCVHYEGLTELWDVGFCSYTPGLKYICEQPLRDSSHQIIG